jgi:Questin oxidase-like
MTPPIPDNLFHSEKAAEKAEISQSITLLELLTQVYESKILHPPMPYNPDALLSARTRLALDNGGAEEIHRICSQCGLFGDFKEADLASKVEECIWVCTLLLASTGREGRKPRLDFFLMHLVTSSLFLQSFSAVLSKPEHKAALLSAYIHVFVLIVLTRGRPRINPELLMSYTDVPRPPVSAGSLPKHSSTSLGNPENDTDYNPWPAIIEAVQYHHDSHVPKTLRTLIFASQKYGDKAPGAAIGAFCRDSGAETHKGTGKMDGTIFVRAAGLVMNTLGWVSYGEKEGEWDRSALGWDAAWDSGD